MIAFIRSHYLNFEIKKNDFFLNRFITKVVLVNWFVAWVSWVNDDACNLILLIVVIGRSIIEDMRYSRAFAWELISVRYWFICVLFTDFVSNMELPNADTAILVNGIPSKEWKRNT